MAETALYAYLTEVELRCSGLWKDAAIDWLLGSRLGNTSMERWRDPR